MNFNRKKILLSVFGFIFVIAFGAGIAVWTNLSRIVKAGIEYYGPQVLGTSVHVRSVSLSPFSGTGEIRGLVIGNPSGFSEDHLMHLDRAAVAIDLKSLTSDRIHVRYVDVESPDVVWEGNFTDSNLSEVQKHAAKFASTMNSQLNASSTTTEKSDSKAAARKFLIDRITMKNIKATAHLRGVAGVTIPLPNIEMTELGSHGGITAGEIIGQLFGRLSSDIISGITKAPALIGNTLQQGTKFLGGLIPAFGSKKKH